MLIKRISIAVVLSIIATSSFAANFGPIEPRSVTWNIVSDAEMSSVCRKHGLRGNCEGMAAWDQEFRMCVVWTRSPRGPNDIQRWRVLHHELKHCQEGHFHH